MKSIMLDVSSSASIGTPGRTAQTVKACSPQPLSLQDEQAFLSFSRCPQLQRDTLRFGQDKMDTAVNNVCCVTRFKGLPHRCCGDITTLEAFEKKYIGDIETHIKTHRAMPEFSDDAVVEKLKTMRVDATSEQTQWERLTQMVRELPAEDNATLTDASAPSSTPAATASSTASAASSSPQKSVWQRFKSGVQRTASGIKAFFVKLWDILKKVWQSLVTDVKRLFGKAPPPAQTAADAAACPIPTAP